MNEQTLLQIKLNLKHVSFGTVQIHEISALKNTRSQQLNDLDRKLTKLYNTVLLTYIFDEDHRNFIRSYINKYQS